MHGARPHSADLCMHGENLLSECMVTRQPCMTGGAQALAADLDNGAWLIGLLHPTGLDNRGKYEAVS